MIHDALSFLLHATPAEMEAASDRMWTRTGRRLTTPVGVLSIILDVSIKDPVKVLLLGHLIETAWNVAYRIEGHLFDDSKRAIWDSPSLPPMVKVRTLASTGFAQRINRQVRHYAGQHPAISTGQPPVVCEPAASIQTKAPWLHAPAEKRERLREQYAALKLEHERVIAGVKREFLLLRLVEAVVPADPGHRIEAAAHLWCMVDKIPLLKHLYMRSGDIEAVSMPNPADFSNPWTRIHDLHPTMAGPVRHPSAPKARK